MRITCWPRPSSLGMLFYGVSVALYLAYAGLWQGMAGPLLWPVVTAHGIVAGLLLAAWRR